MGQRVVAAERFEPVGAAVFAVDQDVFARPADDVVGAGAAAGDHETPSGKFGAEIVSSPPIPAIVSDSSGEGSGQLALWADFSSQPSLSASKLPGEIETLTAEPA